jgi:hypothetical protein
MHTKTPHPLNAPGDFYVEDGCCTSCELPFHEAPGHFKYDSTAHCYVCRQPATVDETDRMISAVSVSEVSCIRYRGSDPLVIQKLVVLKERDQCDVLLGEPPPVAEKRKVWWAFWRQ